MPQQMIDRDRMPGIAGALPGGDGRRLIERQHSLAHENPCQRRHHRFGRGEAEDRRIDAIAIRIAFADDTSIPDHHDRLGAAEWRLFRLGESAVECCGKLRGLRRDNRRSGDLGQSRLRRFAFRRGQRDIRDRAAVIEIATETFAIDGVAAAEAQQRHHHIPARPVDPVIQRPGDQADAGHRRGRVRENSCGILSGNECLRAENIGDKTCRHLWKVAGPHGRQGQSTEGGRCGEGEN